MEDITGPVDVRDRNGQDDEVLGLAEPATWKVNCRTYTGDSAGRFSCVCNNEGRGTTLKETCPWDADAATTTGIQRRRATAMAMEENGAGSKLGCN
jgi:hypothetical protein